MEINWTVEYSLDITDDEMQEIADFAHDYIKQGIAREDAITTAVGSYLEGQDDFIYYSITDEATEQIEAKVNEYLTEQGMDGSSCLCKR